MNKKINIKNKELFNLLSELSNLSGISSREQEVANFIKNKLSKYHFTFERDNLGSLAVIKKAKNSNRPIVSFTAHMDEVGFMITSIEKEGYIKFSPIGGWWGHVLLGQQLKIVTDKGDEIIGVVGSKPPHILKAPEASRVIKPSEMFLDIGANSDKEIKELGIKIGNQIVPNQFKTVPLLNERIVGKAHDDRASIAVGIEVMKKLANNNDVNAIFVASVQEEVGLRGARTSAYKWTPDIAFAIDVTIANDTPGIPKAETILGSGPALSLFDSSIIGNPKLISHLEEVAKKYKIPYTFDSLTGGGTDAGLIHLTKEGVITMTISIPSRYMHSHNSIVDLKDVENTINLIFHFIQDLTQKDLENIKFS